MSAETFRKLRALGLTPEQIEGVLEMMDAQEAAFREAEEARKAVTRERVQRWRDKKREAGNVTVTLPKRNGNATERLTRDPAHVEDNLQTKSQAGQEKGKEETRASAPPTPQQELEVFVDPETAAAIVEHRRKLGKPLTARAARGVGKQLAKWPDPVEAANEMMANGWLSFEPSWLENRTRGAARAPPAEVVPLESRPARNAGEVALRKLNGTHHEPPNPDNRRVDPGDRTGQANRPGIARQFTLAPGTLGRMG